MPDMTEAELVEMLADAMHEAWIEETARQGGHHPDDCPCGDEFYYCGKCHNSMIPYADLSEPVKELDRAGARRFFAFARAHADAVCRLLGGAGPEEMDALRLLVASEVAGLRMILDSPKCTDGGCRRIIERAVGNLEDKKAKS